MAPVEVRQITFFFKGKRNYIQGPDIFNAMIEGYLPATLKNIRFFVHDLVLVPKCRLYLADSKEEMNAVHNIKARCQYDVGGVTRWLALTPADADPSKGGRQEYDEDRVISLCRTDIGSIVLSQRSPFTFMENIVSMNKHLHQHLFPDMTGKWLFTRVDLRVGCDSRENVELIFRHNMNFRLTKSDILVDGKKAGELFFSLVKP
jgi:hypothetical protein